MSKKITASKPSTSTAKPSTAAAKKPAKKASAATAETPVKKASTRAQRPDAVAAPVAAPVDAPVAAPVAAIDRAEFESIVRAEAHSLALARGFRNGSPFADWIRAEAAVLSRLAAEGRVAPHRSMRP